MSNEDYKHGILKNIVTTEGELREYLVNYVGEKLDPDNGEVTVEMIIQVLASEFPEVLIGVIEENYLLGYEQGLNDKELK
tara:strand:+ start:563 stop:802 length:240 start_codon:yes stop_codon:yes gene_type:complete